MSSNIIRTYLSRRYLTEDGWLYFCRLCGDYKHESEFYKNKETAFGVSYKCKEHYKSVNEEDKEMEYLNLNPIRDSDFEGAQALLENLGYKFGKDQPPVWEQFEIKHNIKKQKK